MALMTIEQARQLLRDYAAHPERNPKVTLDVGTINALSDKYIQRWIMFFVNTDPCAHRLFTALFGEDIVKASATP